LSCSTQDTNRNDLEFMEFLGVNNVPFARIFTKSDKLNTTAVADSVNNYNTEMLKNWDSMPVTFITSAVKGNGRSEILDYIEESINNFSNIT
jgi:GTP-binding protein